MKRAILPVVLIATTACVTVNKTILNDRSHSPVPAGQVTIYLADDVVPDGCERVAILNASGDQDLTDQSDIYNKLREEAGKLGANAIHVRKMEDAGTGEEIASALLGTTSDRDSEALALYCPS